MKMDPTKALGHAPRRKVERKVDSQKELYLLSLLLMRATSRLTPELQYFMQTKPTVQWKGKSVSVFDLTPEEAASVLHAQVYDQNEAPSSVSLSDAMKLLGMTQNEYYSDQKFDERVEKRFRALARKCHPDVAGNTDAMRDAFIELTRAKICILDAWHNEYPFESEDKKVNKDSGSEEEESDDEESESEESDNDEPDKKKPKLENDQIMDFCEEVHNKMCLSTLNSILGEHKDDLETGFNAAVDTNSLHPQVALMRYVRSNRAGLGGTTTPSAQKRKRGEEKKNHKSKAVNLFNEYIHYKGYDAQDGIGTPDEFLQFVAIADDTDATISNVYIELQGSKVEDHTDAENICIGLPIDPSAQKRVLRVFKAFEGTWVKVSAIPNKDKIVNPLLNRLNTYNEVYIPADLRTVNDSETGGYFVPTSFSDDFEEYFTSLSALNDRIITLRSSNPEKAKTLLAEKENAMHEGATREKKIIALWKAEEEAWKAEEGGSPPPKKQKSKPKVMVKVKQKVKVHVKPKPEGKTKPKQASKKVRASKEV